MRAPLVPPRMHVRSCECCTFTRRLYSGFAAMSAAVWAFLTHWNGMIPAMQVLASTGVLEANCANGCVLSAMAMSTTCVSVLLGAAAVLSLLVAGKVAGVTWKVSGLVPVQPFRSA